MTRRPWLIIALWVLAAAGVIATSPSVSSVTNSDQAGFLPSTAESARAAAVAESAFPASDGATAVVVVQRRDSGALTEADLRDAGRLAQTLNAEKPEAVVGVAFDPTRQVAQNRTVALLGVQFTGPPERSDVQQAVRDLRTEARTTLTGTDLEVGITGHAAIMVDNKQSFADAERIVTLATVGLIVVLLLLIFRSPIAALLPLVTVGLVYGVSQSLIAAAATVFDFEVGQELPTMLTVVLFGIGTDYILFLLFRYRERLRAGDSPPEAIVAAVERVGEAIFSAALAVVAAFGALVLAVLGFFTTLGPALAIGVTVMLLAALTLVPAIVAVLGRRTFWPSANSREARHTGFARLGRLVARRPAAVAVVCVALLAGLAAGALRFTPDYDPIAQLPKDTEAATAFADLQRGFPAGTLQPTTVYLTGDRPFSPAEMAAFTQRLAGLDGVASPLAPQAAADGRTVAVPLVLDAAPYSPEALDLVSGPLRDAARTAAPDGGTVVVGGASMAYADVRDTTNRDFSLVFPVAGALFVLILMGLLRAALAPLYLVAMVVAGFAATLGATTWVFAGDGLTFTIPIILYLFVTAIGTDYNILMTARLREEVQEGRSPRDAAALAILHAGPSVAAAAVILAGTFGSLLISGVPFFAQIGFAVTLGILLVAFVVSMLLVPAVTVLVGRAAWWPGRTRRGDNTAASGVDQEVLSGSRRSDF